MRSQWVVAEYQLDRVLRSQLFREEDKSLIAKALKGLVEDQVLGLDFRQPASASIDQVRQTLESYARTGGCSDPSRIRLSAESNRIIFERTAPRIFISHLHSDDHLASALVSILNAAFEVSWNDIRCTSVSPHKLPAGVATFERLRTDIRGAEVVLGVISPEVSGTTFVHVELITAWAYGRLTFPLLVRGANPLNVPEPIRDAHALDLARPAECHQLIEELVSSTTCREFGISRKTGYKIFEEGLSDRTRRPVRYANQLPEQIEAAIVAAKREKPHRGARKIRERLRRLPHGVKVPASSTMLGSWRDGWLSHLDKMRRDVAPQKVAKWCTPPLACDAMPLTIRATQTERQRKSRRCSPHPSPRTESAARRDKTETKTRRYMAGLAAHSSGFAVNRKLCCFA